MGLERVVLAKCNSYENKEVETAIDECLNLIGFDFSKYAGKKILLKPNVLAPHKPNDAITTNPAVVEAVCKILKRYNCKIFIGDSSFHNTDEALDVSGMKEIAKKYGTLVNFEKDGTTLFTNEKNKVLKKVFLPKIIREVDLIINLCKLKTHSLTKMTCAIKNLYGLIPGGMKSVYHKKAPSEYLFSELLIELYDFVKSKLKLTICDAVIGIEGEGPGIAGEKKKTDLIIASESPIALDMIAAEVIGYKREEVITNKLAVKRLIAPIPVELGSGKGIRLNYKKPKTSSMTKNMSFLAKLMVPDGIAFNYHRCIKCGLCAKNCPTKAIKLNPFPIWSRRRCIKCYCCIEGCPKKAVSTKEHFLGKLFRKTIYMIKGT